MRWAHAQRQGRGRGGREQHPGDRSGADGGKGQNLGEAQWKPGRGRNAQLLEKAAEGRGKLKYHWGGNLVSLTKGWEGSRELGLISGAQWRAGGGGWGSYGQWTAGLEWYSKGAPQDLVHVHLTSYPQSLGTRAAKF